MKNRLRQLRLTIDEIIFTNPPDKARYYTDHLYSVSHFCVLLALRRGLDAELAAACGMLHDIYPAATGDYGDHAANGARRARAILTDSGMYTADETELIANAIARHTDKHMEHGPYDEALKDADVLSHTLYDPSDPVSAGEYARFTALMTELGCAPNAI